MKYCLISTYLVVVTEWIVVVGREYAFVEYIQAVRHDTAFYVISRTSMKWKVNNRTVLVHMRPVLSSKRSLIKSEKCWYFSQFSLSQEVISFMSSAVSELRSQWSQHKANRLFLCLQPKQEPVKMIRQSAFQNGQFHQEKAHSLKLTLLFLNILFFLFFFFPDSTTANCDRKNRPDRRTPK